MLIERLSRLYMEFGVPAPLHDQKRDSSEYLGNVRKFIVSIMDSGDNRQNLFTHSQQSRRKPVKLAYLLLAGESDRKSIHEAFERSGLVSHGQKQNRAEHLMWLAGTEALARGIHPYLAFLIMTAWFGSETAEKEYQWLSRQAQERETALDEYIVPGELTDMLEEAAGDPAALAQAIRIAGMPLSASALAGCPRYYLDSIFEIIGPLGSEMLRELIVSARQKLTSDEIETAQQAFAEVFSRQQSELAERNASGEMPGAETEFADELTVDADLVRTITDIVLLAEAKVLKNTLSSMSDVEIAAILRCMEAIAHERLLSLISTGRQKRVLSVIQDSAVPSPAESLRNAQYFVQKLLASYAPKTLKPGETLGISEEVRSLISSVLRRE